MPKNSLEGHQTTSGWNIVRRINSTLGSGGNFCSRYEVVSPSGNQIGFMKAMDLADKVGCDIREIQEKINIYVFEQDILEFCKDRKMTRVVSPIEVGTVKCVHFPDAYNTVYYAIFDMAVGDLRSAHLEIENHNKNWESAFRALHHAAIGIKQLHQAEIAHQDIKPSNILSFNSESYKVSDLGRVVDRKGTSPFRSLIFPGDQGYKPTEMFYGVPMSEFSERLSCDMYMIGSLIYHVVEDIQLNMIVLDEGTRLHSGIRTLSFADALPFLISAFNKKLSEYREKCTAMFGHKIAEILHVTVHEMCHPDPNQRGNKKYKNDFLRYGLEKYISKLSRVILLAKNQRI